MDSRKALWSLHLFAAFFAAVLVLDPQVNAVTARYVAVLHSEMTARERLSCFSAIAAMLAGWLMLSHATDRPQARRAALFLALGVTIYMGEGNLLKEKLQPVVGLLILLPLAIALHAQRAWMVTLLLVVAFGCMGSGWVLDQLPKYDALYSRVPVGWRGSLGPFEEYLEAIGTGLVALATMMAALPVLSRFLERNVAPWMTLHGGALIVAVGQGFMHWYNRLTPVLKATGLSLAILGCALGALAVGRLRSRSPELLCGPVAAVGCCLLFVVFPAVWIKSWPVSVGGWLVAMGMVASIAAASRRSA
ncbi:MAG TPA: hypothetical protein VJM11_03825 [Nevskiaceae bacterium]|nr:hypothetical protein [Nevskiaceae bacterium]